jgi:fanconi-associated nuclease 1
MRGRGLQLSLLALKRSASHPVTASRFRVNTRLPGTVTPHRVEVLFGLLHICFVLRLHAFAPMALRTRSPSVHNKLLGEKIKHPPSANFDDDFPTSASKRLKRLDSLETSDDENASRAQSPTSQSRTEVSDSGGDGDDDRGVPLPSSQTALESSLPAVKTDKEAIAEYEAYKSSEQTLKERLGNGRWEKGRSSIYVDAFNLALETVLEEEGHLFDEAELNLFLQWKNLNYESQYLYVRLFLRKTSAWHRISKLGYYDDIADLDAAIVDLQKERELPSTSHPVQTNPGELESPEGTTLGETFKFAECSSEHITTLDEASSLLLLDELKSLAKEARVHGKNKKELLIALRQTSSKQSGLDFQTLRRSETEESTAPAISEGGSTADEEANTDGTLTPSSLSRTNSRANRDAHFTRKILDGVTGRCIRLSLAPLKLFERVHLVFYRSTEWTEKSLTTLILAKISRRNFPEYIVSRSTTIFSSRALLLEFEASLRVQFRVDSILEFNGTPGRKGLEEVKAIFEEVYPRWRVLLAEEQAKEDRIYESGEGAYLRRFNPAWVYTRIIHKGLHPLGRFKEHLREHKVLCELLAQRLFHGGRRGAWYQRKALLEEHYMWALEPAGDKAEEARKKHWKRVALRTCEEGLEDRECHVIYHYDLQKRIKKLEKQLKLPVREQHDFGHVSLSKAVERDVTGIRIERDDTPTSGRRGSVVRRDSEPQAAFSGSRRGGKTIWVDELDTGEYVSVEEMCLSWYRKKQGWKGYHSEGGILRMLFGLLFYDILFAYVPNVFQTAYQTCPLDLHTDAFYDARVSEINRRLVEIGNGAAERLLKETWDREFERKTCVVGVRWEEYDMADLLEIVRCFRGEALGVVMLTMAQEYAARGGGVPDLFLWRMLPGEKRGGGGGGGGGGSLAVPSGAVEGEVMFVEVKSENDRLSETQRLWISVLLGAGIRVELCHAVAREVRVER